MGKSDWKFILCQNTVLLFCYVRFLLIYLEFHLQPRSHKLHKVIQKRWELTSHLGGGLDMFTVKW